MIYLTDKIQEDLPLPLYKEDIQMEGGKGEGNQVTS